MNINQAIEENNLDRVKELLDSGLNVNTKIDEKHIPILIKAIEKNNYGIVKLLIDRGADINLKDDGDWNALSVTYLNGFNDIQELLEETGRITDEDLRDVYDTIRDLRGMSLSSIIEGDIDTLVELLDNRLPVNFRDADSCTLLINAVKMNNTGIVRLLIERGADINLRDKKNWDALTWAYFKGSNAIINLLIETGKISEEDMARAESIGKEEKEIKRIERLREEFYEYCEEENLDEIRRIITEERLDINIYLTYGRETALGLIAQTDKIEVARLLLDLGSNINQQNEDNETPLMQAVEHNRVEMVTLLLERGANINLINDDNQMAWQIALERNRLDILALLIDPERQPAAPAEPEANPEENLRVATTACAICTAPKNYNITDVNLPFIVHNLPCGHTFHNVCINQWFTQKRVRNEPLLCPICRVPAERSSRVMLGGFYNKYQKYIVKLKM
jgi:ankyrin repeat protein